MICSLDLIHDDVVLVEVLSFLDFRASIRAGRTCKRLKNASDKALDRWADRILASDGKTLAKYKVIDFKYDSWGESVLRRGWSNEFRSRAALIEKAIDDFCDPLGDFDEDRARYLFRRRGHVDAEDFGPWLTDDSGWNVRIWFKDCTSIDKDQLASYVDMTIKALDPEDEMYEDHDEQLSRIFGNSIHNRPSALPTVEKVEKDPSDEKALHLQHCFLCLLRQADPASIRISRVKAEYGHKDCPTTQTQGLILFRLPEPDNTKVEYHFNTSYETM